MIKILSKYNRQFLVPPAGLEPALYRLKVAKNSLNKAIYFKEKYMREFKCKKCEKTKNETAFNKHKEAKTGYHSWCKSCANENSKKWYQKNKKNKTVSDRIKNYNTSKKNTLQKIVADLKAELGCGLCGEKEPICLDFHHKNGKKEKNISEFVQMKSVKNLVLELTKCVCVCSNCHRKIHGNILKCPDLTLQYALIVNKFEKLLIKTRTKKSKKVTCKKEKQTNRMSRRKVSWPEKIELEKMVWEKPTTLIAKNYGVSDKAVAGWCKKYQISKPPVGYWSKKKVGHVGLEPTTYGLTLPL